MCACRMADCSLPEMFWYLILITDQVSGKLRNLLPDHCECRVGYVSVLSCEVLSERMIISLFVSILDLSG